MGDVEEKEFAKKRVFIDEGMLAQWAERLEVAQGTTSLLEEVRNFLNASGVDRVEAAVLHDWARRLSLIGADVADVRKAADVEARKVGGILTSTFGEHLRTALAAMKRVEHSLLGLTGNPKRRCK